MLLSGLLINAISMRGAIYELFWRCRSMCCSVLVNFISPVSRSFVFQLTQPTIARLCCDLSLCARCATLIGFPWKYRLLAQFLWFMRRQKQQITSPSSGPPLEQLINLHLTQIQQSNVNLVEVLEGKQSITRTCILHKKKTKW